MGCSITAARGECHASPFSENATVRNKETCVTRGSLSTLLWPQAPISSTVAAVFMLLSLQHPR